MAKRVRGSRSAHRPGGQGPSRAKAGSRGPDSPAPVNPEAPPRPAVDIDGAVEMVEMGSSELEIEDRVATPRTHKARRGARVRADSLIARATAENTWVTDDLRRIGFVSIVLVTGLLIAWVLFVPLDLASLY